MISHSSPGHYLRGPYGRNLELLLVLSRYHQTLPLDLGVLVNLLEEVLGYRLNHLIMSSSNDSRVPPSVHQACHSLIPRKAFLRKRKDLSRMLSEPDAFSFDVFSDFQLWRSLKYFFKYHLGYFEIPAFSILCSDLSSIRSFSFGFIFFIRYCTKPFQTNVIYNSAER